MSDPNDPNAPDPENPDAPDAPEQTGAVYPVNDGQGGTAYVIGNTSEPATYEQWAAQNSAFAPTAADDEVEYDDDGNPIDPDEPEAVEFGTIEGTEAEKVSAVAAAVDDAT